MLVYAAVQSQNAVSTYYTSKQILPFDFAEKYTGVIITKIYQIKLIKNVTLESGQILAKLFS